MTRDRAIEIFRDDASGASLFELAEAVDMAIEALKEQRPHGEWLRKNNSNSWFECSVCKEVSNVVTIMREPIWNFCPCCGARMTGEGEAE